MRCSFCRSKKTRKIRGYYDYRIFRIPVYTLFCNKCTISILPLKEENKLNKKLEQLRRRDGYQ